MDCAKVIHISECFIKPKFDSKESTKPIHLAPWDLVMISVQYIQKGLLFAKPPSLYNQQENQEDSIQILLTRIKDSLSEALVHFYPLAGRLVTLKQECPKTPYCSIFIDCNNSPGAKFIYATLDLTISDILSPTDVPLVVQSLFDHDRAINHDGHTMPLLSIQVTELRDGIFIGCSINHVLVDGSSYWHFFNAWSEIFRAKEKSISISKPPIIQRWLPHQGHDPIHLPADFDEKFITRHETPPLRERIFHFSAKSLAKLKAKANSECNCNNGKISSLQALSALMWRCVTRARLLPSDQRTNCRLAINNRSRLDPPLPENYFGNCIETVKAHAGAGELLEQGLGWAAWRAHQAVANHTDEMVRQFVDAWLQSPFAYQLGPSFFDPYSIMMGSSPRFDMYGNEFGLGKAVAVLSGYAHKFDGKVTLYEGIAGGGSMDLEVCLLPQFMSALECDQEFLDAMGVGGHPNP